MLSDKDWLIIATAIDTSHLKLISSGMIRKANNRKVWTLDSYFKSTLYKSQLISEGGDNWILIDMSQIFYPDSIRDYSMLAKYNFFAKG